MRLGPKPIRTAIARRLPGLVALLLICGPSPSNGLDLTDLLSDTMVHVETSHIDFGTGEDQPHLLEGWSHSEGPTTNRFVWAMGGSSSIRIFLIAPGSRSFLARCRPFVFPTASAQVVTVRVNGERVGSTQLQRGLTEIRWQASAEVLRAGYNRIDFEYGYHAAPADVLDSSDRRSLAVAWHELIIEGGIEPRATALPTKEGEALLLPLGQRLDFLVRASGPAYLELGAITSEDARADLRLRVEGDRSGELANLEIGRGQETLGLELAFSGDDVLRLSMTAMPDEGPSSTGVLRVGRLELHSAASPAAPASGWKDPLVRMERPHVLIYVVDSLRADHLGIYDYRRPVAPNIEGFAKDGVTFANARAASSWTRPTVASILTGLHPWSHGVAGRFDALSDEASTLAETLQSAGYATAGIITNGNVAREFGLAQGFDRYIQLPEVIGRYGVHESAERACAAAEAWFGTRSPKRPFFVYIHVTDPHAPYAPDEEFRARFAANVENLRLSDYEFQLSINRLEVDPTEALRRDLIALYDAEIAFVDSAFGRLLYGLREQGLYDDTLIVLVADHGEEFLDHGWWAHGKTLYEEQLRVPLVLKFPRSWMAGLRISEPAQQVDVTPTILAYLDLSAATAQRSDGIDLTTLVQGSGETREVVSTLDLDGRRVDAIVAGRWKLIEYGDYVSPGIPHVGKQLFDLSSDPEERHNLIDRHPILADYLGMRLAAQRRSLLGRFEGATAEVDGTRMQQLRALGYFEGEVDGHHPLRQADGSSKRPAP